ncbi:MAG: Rha family transcriptional regulator [Pseudomonadota bacterium]
MTSVQVFSGAIAGHQHSLTTSRIVAKSFGKRHDDVLKAVRGLECSDEFNVRNFAAVEYRDAKGEARPEYQMTRDGFMFLAMGFTGARAAQMKELFIAAFNDMETALARRAEADIQRLAKVFAPELLRADPRRRQLVRYRRLGLTLPEIQRLTGRGHQQLQREYRLLEACGLIQVDAKRLARRQVALANLARIGGAQ